MLIYYIICKFISPPTETLIDEAVLPPQKGEVIEAEEASSPASDRASYEKGDMARVKEVSV